MTIITVGIDLAKNVFAVYGVDDSGKAVLVKPKVARDKLAELISELDEAATRRKRRFCRRVEVKM